MEKDSKISVDSFFKKEYKKLVNYVRKNMENRYGEESPEDIIQDVALSLITNLNVQTQVDNIAGYIYRSLKNRIIDIQRKKKRNISIDSMSSGNKELSDLTSIPDEPYVDDSIFEKYNPEMLHTAINKLRPDEQLIIKLTEFGNYTFDDLAQEWNVPIGTLLSRKHRAIAKLNKLITIK